MMKINVNYFVVTKKLDNIRYFLDRGNFFKLVWDRFKWHWFPRLNIVPVFPQTVDIESSLYCNLKCPMCTRAQSDQFNSGGNMDFTLYQKIIDECAANNVFSIKLSWRGEPTLNPRLLDMVRYAKQKGIPDVAFLSNGGLMTPEFTQDLIEAGLDWISFSIDGLYQEYEKIRYPIKFSEIVETVKRFKALKREKGVKKPLVRIQTISGVLESQPEYFSFWEPLVDRISVIAEQHRENPELIKHDPDYVCQAPFQRIFLTWNGDVASCHGDYFLHNNMGNVNNTSIKDIWNNSKFIEFRKAMRSRKRLEYDSCKICPDGGEYISDKLVLGKRKLNIIRYLNDKSSDAQT